MTRRTRVALAVLAGLVALLGANAILTSAETKTAELTVPGGRILDLSGGDVQVVDRGPPEDSAIVLIHGFTCAIDWWKRMIPHFERNQRVVAVDLLGHGGSEKPGGGYTMESQAALVSEALRRLGVRSATVVGHSLGAVVATAMSEASPSLVDRVVVLDQAPDSNAYGARLPLPLWLTFKPVVGEALWRLAPDFSIKDGLSVGFAPGYDVPDEFVEDFRRLTYTAYDESAEAESDYSRADPLDVRLRRTGTPLLAVFGAEEQIFDPEESLAAYRAVPGARTVLVPGAGHSPNVERPVLTAKLVERFARRKSQPFRPGTAMPATKKGRPEGRPR
jgi:pimeloyl-ACP methyl ester carboxylesterase